MKRDSFASEVKFVEFTARYLWQFFKPFVRSQLSRRCKRCVLSENYTRINADGICSECAATSSTDEGQLADHQTSFALELDQVIREAAGTGSNNADALLLYSGGKDSSFLLHRLQTQYPGLRVVTLLVDNGLMSPYALANAARALNHFNVEHWTIRLNPDFVHKVFRHALTNLDRQDGYSLVDKMDAYLTFDLARNIAARNGIPLVVCGLSKVQTKNIFGLENVFEFPVDEERGGLRDRCNLGWQNVLTAEEMNFWWDGSKWPADRVPRFLLPYCAWDFDEEFILHEVDRLGLIDRKESRPLMTNNRLIPVIGMAEVSRFGYSSFEVEFAQMVREGKSDRKYWLSIFEMLEYSTKSGRFIGRNVQETLATLNLTKRDIGIEHS